MLNMDHSKDLAVFKIFLNPQPTMTTPCGVGPSSVVMNTDLLSTPLQANLSSLRSLRTRPGCQEGWPPSCARPQGSPSLESHG